METPGGRRGLGSGSAVPFPEGGSFRRSPDISREVETLSQELVGKRPSTPRVGKPETELALGSATVPIHEESTCQTQTKRRCVREE